MTDIIQLLPDSVANQIAAGEVIQRPASAVKELLENAIDSKATVIKLFIKDAGKTLIQVIDNGSGMSVTDARLSFERHATSKITKADDLFALTTKGFRGEALASIAAIAQVEMTTRREADQLGTKITIEGSEFKEQVPVNSPVGTSFSMKNLFFNVPARRNFLKSNTVELRHIIDEFLRVAIPHPEITFCLYNGTEEIYNLPKSNFRSRIVNILGNSYNERLVPVEEETQIVKLSGFLVKPEFSKKTRGDQYFFVNDRFIKSSYLQHAVTAAFEGIIPSDSFPTFFIKMTIDPKTIDINIHPTKTEIKFEDEKAVYMILRSAVKQSLGKYNIAPSIDFDQEASLYNIPLRSSKDIVQAPQIKVDPTYNPFNVINPGKQRYNPSSIGNNSNWQELYKGLEKQSAANTSSNDELINEEVEHEKPVIQVHNKYIITPIKSGIIIIDQQAAHERILFERYLSSLNQHKGMSQQLLFPESIELNPADAIIITELLEELHNLGFDINSLGKNTFSINGIPSACSETESVALIEKLLEQYKQTQGEVKLGRNEQLALSMARSTGIKAGKALSTLELKNLVDELFACENPYTTPTGKPTITNITNDELDKKFLK